MDFVYCCGNRFWVDIGRDAVSKIEDVSFRACAFNYPPDTASNFTFWSVECLRVEVPLYRNIAEDLSGLTDIDAPIQCVGIGFDLFEPGEIAGLHINFPDPWKREINAKHRLVNRELVAWAATALRPGGTVRIKSDHRPNVARFVDAAADHPFSVVDFIDDIEHNGAPWPDDLVTNYQSKFIARGEPIYAAMLTRDA